MDRWERDNADVLGMALKEAGFQTSQRCCCRPSCFDFAARKGDKTILVKTRSDVDSFTVTEARELRIIAGHLGTAALVVSDRSHDKPFEDDTVYSRYSVYVVTEKTLRNVAFEKGFPLVNAGPGGYFVEVDGTLVEKSRKELGLSVGELAEMVGVSRRTLYGYERCMAKASVSSAYNLAKVLGIPVARPVNVLKKRHKQRFCLLIRTKHKFAGRLILGKVFRKFASCDISPVEKAPFDFVINLPGETSIIGAIIASNEDLPEIRTEELLSVSQVVNAHPMLITEKKESFRNDVMCISADELTALKSPLELAASI
jgi:predicted transcriptional regulator